MTKAVTPIDMIDMKMKMVWLLADRFGVSETEVAEMWADACAEHDAKPHARSLASGEA